MGQVYKIITVSPFLTGNDETNIRLRTYIVLAEGFEHAGEVLESFEDYANAHMILASRQSEHLILCPEAASSLDKSISLSDWKAWFSEQHSYRVLRESDESLEQWHDRTHAHKWAI